MMQRCVGQCDMGGGSCRPGYQLPQTQHGKNGRQQYWHWVQLLRDASLVFFLICHRYPLLEPIPILEPVSVASPFSNLASGCFLHVHNLDSVCFKEGHLIL